MNSKVTQSILLRTLAMQPQRIAKKKKNKTLSPEMPNGLNYGSVNLKCKAEALEEENENSRVAGRGLAKSQQER